MKPMMVFVTMSGNFMLLIMTSFKKADLFLMGGGGFLMSSGIALSITLALVMSLIYSPMG
jgi:hypothetical protein